MHLHYSHTQEPAASSNKVLALKAHPSLLLLSTASDLVRHCTQPETTFPRKRSLWIVSALSLLLPSTLEETIPSPRYQQITPVDNRVHVLQGQLDHPNTSEHYALLVQAEEKAPITRTPWLS